MQEFHDYPPVTARTAFAASSAETLSPVRRDTIALAASCAAFEMCARASPREAAMRASAFAMSACAAASASCLALSMSPAIR